MRLTLRTLLAYLDDTLPPDQAREIGQKVAESHVAQELMERIKKVTRRRGLTVPPVAGPERIDANTVAEYLDNDLPADRVAEVEEMALNSDVHLAEISACHQILTLVLGEPAHVPPTARERMYGLVQGKESEPHRRASRIGPPAFPGEAESADEARAARRGIGYRLLGACVLGIALAICVWQALPGKQQLPTPLPNETANSGTPADVPPPAPDPEPNFPMTDPKPPAPDPKPSAPDPKPPIPDPKPAIVKTPDRSPSSDRKDVGQFTSKDAVLLALDGKVWAKVAADAKVRTAGALLALPGSHAELKLDGGARLTLWGGLPETTGWKILDCQVTLHAPSAGFDADFTLDHGRVFVSTSKATGPTKVRVRIAEQIWDVTLADDQSEVVIDVVRLFAGEPIPHDDKAESPRTEVMLGVVAGTAQVNVDAKDFNLKTPPGPAELFWASKGTAIDNPVDRFVSPPAWAKTPAKLPRDRQLDIEAAQRKLIQGAGQKDKEIGLAVAEVVADPARAAKVLGTLCQGVLGSLTPLLDALADPQIPEVRQAAAVALVHFAAREPGNDVKLLKQFKSYGDRNAELAMWLLHGFDDSQLSDPATYERLIGALRNEQTGVRELAAWRLRQIDPEGAAQAKFSATDPDAAREKSIGEWQRRRLPPARTNPQGRAPDKGRIAG